MKRAGKTAKATRLIVQPRDSIKPLLDGIVSARSSIDVLVFRFDLKEIEQALIDAVQRGVVVRALIAWTNRGGERHLRELETRLLAAGVQVARTANDLVRYHGKMMVVDRKTLFVLAFNFTRLDIDRSRSFGIVTRKPALVREAIRLFESDTTRQTYTPDCADFLVSPLNSREELAAFLKGAKKSLSIYDPGLRDREMVRLLEERANAGVTIRILGKFRRGTLDIPTFSLAQRLHARVIVRDGVQAFVGSQSLRAIELDGRREVGLIVRDRTIAVAIEGIFDQDWKAMSEMPAAVSTQDLSGEKLARKVAKAITRDLPPVSEVVESVASQLTGRKADLAVDAETLEETVRDAVKSAVKDVIEEVALSAAMVQFS